jgi:hypothetical protein
MPSRKKTAAKKKSDAPDGSRPSPIREELETERKASGGPEPIVEAEPKVEPPLQKPPHQSELPPPEVGDDGEFNPIRVDGKDEVPLYNPCEAPVTFQYGGLFWTLPIKGIGLVSKTASIYAVGEDNCGGRLSKLGVRRLYCNEPRFYPFAAKACMPWYEWVEKRNAVVKQMADMIAAGNPYIEELQKLEIPKYSE